MKEKKSWNGFHGKNAYLRRQHDAKDRMSSSLESMVASSNNVSNIGSIIVFGSLDNSSGWSPPRISANDSKAFRQMTGYWSWLSRMISNTPMKNIKNIFENLSYHQKIREKIVDLCFSRVSKPTFFLPWSPIATTLGKLICFLRLSSEDDSPPFSDTSSTSFHAAEN